MHRWFTIGLLTLLPLTDSFGRIINVPDSVQTIQTAIDSSSDGDTVLVQPGTYRENLDFNGHNIVVGSHYITTEDTSYVERTVIDGDANGSVVTFQHGEAETALLCGFTIQNGSGAELDFGDGVEIYGGGILCINSYPTVLKCIITLNRSDNGGGIFCLDSNPCIVNCKINGNSSSDQWSSEIGAGIYCVGSSPIIDNCAVSGNQNDGIYCANGSSPTITGCNINENFGFNWEGWIMGGYGINCNRDCYPTIEDCKISRNSSSGINCTTRSSPAIIDCIITQNGNAGLHGGGVSCRGSCNPTITGCSIDFNFAAAGGGIACEGNSSPDISNCSISQNGVMQYSGLGMFGPGIGAGMYISGDSSPTINHCTISSNTAGVGNWGGGDRANGGGVYCEDGSAPQFVNCTIAKNVAENGDGGGIYTASATNTTLVNSLLWDNDPQAIYCGGWRDSSNITISYSDIAGGEGNIGNNGNGEVNWGEGNIDSDPLFLDAEHNDYHIAANSPCVEAGNPEFPPDPDGTTPDIGAFFFPLRNISVDSLTIGFGTIVANSADTLLFPVANIGLDTLTIFSASILENQAAFSLQPTWQDEEVKLAPGESIGFTIAFNGAAAPGNYNCELFIFSDDPDQPEIQIPISGRIEADAATEREASPHLFALYSAYPNPFNSETRITFSLDREQRISLSVTDLGGREVARIAEGKFNRGVNTFRWNATGIAAGIYLARLQGEIRVGTVKIVLLK